MVVIGPYRGTKDTTFRRPVLLDWVFEFGILLRFLDHGGNRLNDKCVAEIAAVPGWMRPAKVNRSHRTVEMSKRRWNRTNELLDPPELLFSVKRRPR
jgi:hypothetical protein